MFLDASTSLSAASAPAGACDSVGFTEAGDDAPRAVDDGSGMCNAGFAGGDAAHAVRNSLVGRPTKPKRKTPGTTDGGVFLVPGITDGANMKIEHLVARTFFSVLSVSRT